MINNECHGRTAKSQQIKWTLCNVDKSTQVEQYTALKCKPTTKNITYADILIEHFYKPTGNISIR